MLFHVGGVARGYPRTATVQFLLTRVAISVFACTGYILKDKYPTFEVGLKCILTVNPYLRVCSYIK